MRFNKGGGGGGSFERPPTGYCVGVLAAIYDVGIRATPGSSFPPRHQVCFWWEVSHRDSKGNAHSVRDVISMSTMDGSNLANRIEALLGRPMTDAERGDFDPSVLLGRRCKLLLTVSPKKPDGSPFIKMAMPAEASDPALAVEGDYASLPRFVEKLVTEAPVLEAMKREAAAGGGELVKVAKKGASVGSAQAPAGAAKIVGQQAAPPPPPAPAVDGLPPGWRAAKAPDGREYFVGPDGKTQWDRPGSTPPPPPPPAAPAGDDDIPF